MTNWTTDKAKIEQFNKSAAGQGYTPDEALQALGVEKITDLRGGIGAALGELLKVKKGKRAQSALAVLPQDEQRALYATDALRQFGQMVRAFAPWANNEKYPVSDREVALIVQRGAKSGLDVFNPHEVQVWKDKRGNINFQIAHALVAQWVESTHGGHTQPRYYGLTDEEKVDHGIAPGDHVMRCEFIMRSDIQTIQTMVSTGAWEPAEARADVTIVGIGTVSASDWGSTYFAPNARSKRWKLEKRAYADAVRQRFGTPSEADILALRRARGEENIMPADWAIAKDETNGDAMVRHARETANGNGTTETTDTPEETLARNRSILHGDEGDDILDGVVETVEETPAELKPEPLPEEPPATSGDAFEHVQAALDWAMTQGVFNVRAHAKHSYDRCKSGHAINTAEDMGRYWRAKVGAKVRIKTAENYEHDGQNLSAYSLGELSALLTRCDEGDGSPELAEHLLVLIDFLGQDA